ncbi:carbohydrate kinase family protein [Salinactinospora qingdaonensis]|uniref:Carbohydrate kinase n=1 Tax=Salinactinospora qingdaonensis TaxID=702744 RepID=A0ABP7FGP3_9ACTN
MITVVGEALIDLIGAENGTYRSVPGGAPANVAVALARLGVPVSLLARIGSDRFGRELRAYVGSRGVDTRDLVAAAEPSTLAIANLDASGHAEFDFYVRGTADWQWTPAELPDPVGEDVTALHVGSLALAMAPGAAVLEEWIARQRERVVVSYDPNVRPALAGERAQEVQRVERQVALADVVKASEEDLRWLYDEPAPATEQETAAFLAERAGAWLALGPALVVVTRGQEPTLVVARSTKGTPSYHPVERVEVVDSVGAGDALAAGLLDALGQLGALGAGGKDKLATLSAAEVAACLRHAQRVSARACLRVGADPGELALEPVRVEH